MSFAEADYTAAATRLMWPVSHVKAFADVESSGQTSWVVNGSILPPVRLEAQWFHKLTGGRFDATNPDLSSPEWDPSLAATTQKGAWDQVHAAEALDKEAADQAASWGAFQIMGFNYGQCGFASIDEFVADMMKSASGQMDAFVRFIESEPALLVAGREGDWATCETLYNGGGQGGAYAAKLKAAAEHYGDNDGLPRALKQGDEGADVTALQVALGIPADGIFGPATDEAVRDYQLAHDLVSDGVVGTMTRNAMARTA